MVIRPTLHPLDRYFLMYDKMLSGYTGIQKDIVLKLNPFRIYEISWFPWQPFVDFEEWGCLGSPNDQFGAHEKNPGWGGGGRGVQGTLNWPLGKILYVNLRKHDPIDLVYNFIHIYQVRV